MATEFARKVRESKTKAFEDFTLDLDSNTEADVIERRTEACSEYRNFKKTVRKFAEQNDTRKEAPPFLLEELTHAISYLPTNKAIGKDGIYNDQ
eukprot:11861465-Ditylum_brightwellii.AAC.1